MDSLKGLEIILKPIELIKIGQGLQMNVVVPVHLTVSVHDDDVFLRALQDALKLFISLDRLIDFRKLVLKSQVLEGF